MLLQPDIARQEMHRAHVRISAVCVSEEGAWTRLLLEGVTVNAKYHKATCQSFPLCHLQPS